MAYKNLRFNENAVFLVTGGAGFIGSNLCEAILNMGYKVRCLDNLSTGKQDNIDLFIDNPSYSFIRGDITDFATCVDACQDVDYVLHEAAWGSVPRSIEMPLYYEEVNIRGTLNMMEAARQKGVKKFVYASSSSVYGDNPALPKEEGEEGNLLSPYAAVIPKFIKQLLHGEQPVIYGDGKQSRDFTYVENVIEANLKACKAACNTAGQVYNIAYGGREYLIDIFYKLTEALGKKVDPCFEAGRMGDIKHSNADISKAKAFLGYDGEWDFETGIREALQWYQHNL